MRFDYQPAIVDIKILKTYKQRKLFFTIIIGIIGCLILISSIARSIIQYNKPIALNKNLFLASLMAVNNNINHYKSMIVNPNTNLNTNINNIKLNNRNNKSNRSNKFNHINQNNYNFINNNEYHHTLGMFLFMNNQKISMFTPMLMLPISMMNNDINSFHSVNGTNGAVNSAINLSASSAVNRSVNLFRPYYNVNHHNTGGIHLNYYSLIDIPKQHFNIFNSIGLNKQHELQAENLNHQNEWKTVKIKTGDTLISILQNLAMPKVYLKDFNNFIKVNQNCKIVNNLKSGCIVKILLNAEKDLRFITLLLAPHKILHIDKVGPRNYRAYLEEKPIIKKLTFTRGRIMGSFYASAQSVGLNEALILEMADIFGWDIDFSMDVRSNDKFKIIYEEKFVEQEKVGIGHILVAEFINQGQKYQAVRFTDSKGKVGYYTPEGYSMNKTFLRNPVKFTRIGSRFSHSRRHPILHRIRAHKGVDYVAPSGTPIKAAGDGRVAVVAYKGGYGNVVELTHGNKYSTLYAHLSHFANGIKKGQIVKQGQIIGYVGKTGLATGDHLHYEFRVEGKHRDPLTVQLPRAMPLPNRYKAKFLTYAQQMIHLLNEHDNSLSNYKS